MQQQQQQQCTVSGSRVCAGVSIHVAMRGVSLLGCPAKLMRPQGLLHLCTAQPAACRLC
jgi:hypothetical protein